MIFLKVSYTEGKVSYTEGKCRIQSEMYYFKGGNWIFDENLEILSVRPDDRSDIFDKKIGQITLNVFKNV